MHTPPGDIAQLFELAAEPRLVPRYNIAPTQPVGIVRVQTNTTQREWAIVQWGLVPSWSKDPSIGSRMINARAETVADKPSFRAAFRRRRCLVPADGFYEWQRSGSSKQPYYIAMQDGAPFAFAGLWEYWEGADGSALESCTLLTTEPNELMVSIHSRMPVIIARQDYDDWMSSGSEDETRDLSLLRHLLRPYPAREMKAYPVTKYVNSPRNEGVDCIQPVLSKQ